MPSEGGCCSIQRLTVKWLKCYTCMCTDIYICMYINTYISVHKKTPAQIHIFYLLLKTHQNKISITELCSNESHMHYENICCMQHCSTQLLLWCRMKHGITCIPVDVCTCMRVHMRLFAIRIDERITSQKLRYTYLKETALLLL